MFITFEGGEGGGKTTQIRRAADFLSAAGKSVVVTREPGGTGIGAKMRAILMDPENTGLAPSAELFLYLADRAQHLHEVIAPALAEGKWVLCDRYFDATVVYQGYARGFDPAELAELHRFIRGFIRPDLTLVLDLDPAVGLARTWAAVERGDRDGAETRFEREKLRFHEAVRAGYLDLAKKEPERFRVIDASGDAENVGRQVTAVLSAFFAK